MCRSDNCLVKLAFSVVRATMIFLSSVVATANITRDFDFILRYLPYCFLLPCQKIIFASWSVSPWPILGEPR